MNEEHLKQILEMQDENYKNRIGTVFGIFRIDDVRYNWVTNTQEWTVTCTKCEHSEVVPYSVGRDWMRGKGRSPYKCKKCIRQSMLEEKIEKEKKRVEKEEATKLELDGLLNTEIKGWLISSRDGSSFHAFCQICGKERNVHVSEIRKQALKPCQHKKDFSSEEYIGKRYGNLTVIGYEDAMFKVKCDCGFEKRIKPSCAENGKITTCGRSNCNYHIVTAKQIGTGAGLAVSLGHETEIYIQRYLSSL